MHKKIFNALTVLNLIGQALYTLALPIGLGALASYLLTRYAGAPGYIWAILMTVGAIIGFYSMIKFIIVYSDGMDRSDKLKKENERQKKEKEERQARLRADGKENNENNEQAE